MIEYTVRLAEFQRHVYVVDCRLDGVSGSETFEFSSWIPGSYLLREYARHVVHAEAIGVAGEPLPVEKPAHNLWRCAAVDGSVKLRLHVYALDLSVRGAWLDVRRGYFNGPCLFARPLSRPEDPIRLVLEAPQAAPQHRWRVATAMTPVDTDERGFGTYSARDYAELIDHPFEISEFDRVEFAANGVPHAVVVAGRHGGDLERVAGDLQKICSTQIEFFGEPAPFDRYMFLCAAVAQGYGGLEHCYSSSLMFHHDDLPAKADRHVSPRYQRMLSLASHEYFHAWHVKRTLPAAFMPYRLTQRNHTRLLWVFEGITSYYQDRFLLRCGLIDSTDYFRRLAETISKVLCVPGRHVQSLADSSFDAWDKLYKPDSNSPNAGVSYYSKGAIVALALDLEIRRRHDSRLSLDTIVQLLWQEFGAKGVGLPEDGFEALTCRVAGDWLALFFDSAVRGTQDPDLSGLFADFGIEFRLEQSAAPDGQPATVQPQRTERLWLGIAPRSVSEGIECATVYSGAPAELAGINPADVVVALDRRRVSLENVEVLLSRYAAGDEVSVSVFRGDELLEFRLRLAPAPAHTCRLGLADNASAEQVERRSSWLYE